MDEAPDVPQAERPSGDFLVSLALKGRCVCAACGVEEHVHHEIEKQTRGRHRGRNLVRCGGRLYTPDEARDIGLEVAALAADAFDCIDGIASPEVVARLVDLEERT